VQEQLEPILFVLAVGSAVAILAKRVGIPCNVALVLVGALLVFMHALPKTPMDPRRQSGRRQDDQRHRRHTRVPGFVRVRRFVRA
jgi:hypothetical protein